MPRTKRTTYPITTWGGKTERIWLTQTTYADNDSLAVQAWCKEGPYDTITVNIEDSKDWVGTNYQFVDTNNCPWAPEFLEKNGLGRNTGILGFSGFCAYPLFLFEGDKIPLSK